MTAMLVAMSDPLPSATLPPIAGGLSDYHDHYAKNVFRTLADKKI